MIVRVEKRNGRVYIVEKDATRGTLLRINRRPEIQSVSSTGPTGFYFDEAAAAIMAAGVSSVVLLGLGGATTARRLRELGFLGHITGVDSDSTMIELAVEYFDIWAVDDVVLADARKFCLHSGRVFDAAVEDVFVDSNKRVECRTEKIVRKGGLIVRNNFPLPGISKRLCM